VAKNGGDLLRLYRTTTIFIKEFKGSKHVRFAQELNLVDRSSAPLTEVDFTASIDIGLVEDFIGALVNYLLIHLWMQGTVSLEELFTLN